MTRRLALAVLLAAVASAHANGRFPATTSIHVSAERIYLGTTFGLLLSPDDGKTWRWICEDAVGFNGTSDVVYGVTPAGTLLSGTTTGLGVSRDGGCSWPQVGEPLVKAWIADVQVGPDGAVWVATASGTSANDVFVSRDDAKSFSRAMVPETRVYWRWLRVAPSDPSRIYVSGYRVATDPDASTGTEPLLYRREVGGGWTKLTSPAQQHEAALVGVLATDAGVVFAQVPAGKLWRSPDGGMTWTPVLETPAAIAGFVTDPDGKHLLAGAFASEDAGLSWAPVAGAPQIVCLARRGDDTLFACGQNWEPDFKALARSTDGGRTYAKAFRFQEMSGPLACPPATAQKDLCEPQWENLAITFGAMQQGTAPDAAVGPAPPAKKTGCAAGLGPALFALFLLHRRRSRATAGSARARDGRGTAATPGRAPGARRRGCG